MDMMSFIFVLCIAGMLILSNIDNRNGITPHGLEVDKTMFKVSTGFAVGAIIVSGILAALCALFR